MTMTRYGNRLAGGLTADQARLVRVVVWIIVVIVTMTIQHHI
jgi:hypothetical protein